MGQIESKPTEKAKILPEQTLKSNRSSRETSVDPSLEILAGPGYVKVGTTSVRGSKAAESKSESANETTIKEPQKNRAAAHVAPAVELSNDGFPVASTVHRTETGRLPEPALQSISEASPSATPITPTDARLVSDAPAGQKPAPEIRAADPGPRDLPLTGPVREAHMLNRTEQSEMHIGLQTSAFGNVEVHAVVWESQVGLTIGSEHGDLRHILTNEVPAIAGRLQQHDLHLDAVRFLDQGPSFDAGSSAADPRGRSFSYSRANTSSGPMLGDAPSIADSENLLDQQSGLNVRA